MSKANNTTRTIVDDLQWADQDFKETLKDVEFEDSYEAERELLLLKLGFFRPVDKTLTLGELQELWCNVPRGDKEIARISLFSFDFFNSKAYDPKMWSDSLQEMWTRGHEKLLRENLKKLQKEDERNGDIWERICGIGHSDSDSDSEEELDYESESEEEGVVRY